MASNPPNEEAAGGRMSTRSRSPPPGGLPGGGAGTRSSARRASGRPTVDSADADTASAAAVAAAEAAKEAVQEAAVEKRRRGRPPTKGKGKRGPSAVKSENGENDHDDEKDGTAAETNKPKPLVLLGAQPRGLYECDYCGTDLTRTPRARCAVCPDFDLCLECLAAEDHEQMARYKREEEKIRRKEAEKLAGVEEGEKDAKKGRGGKKGKLAGEDDPNALGSYVGGVWVPYFRHDPGHGYLIADSARYTLFPSFRGVRAVEPIEIVDDEEGKKVGDSGTSEEKQQPAPVKEEETPAAPDVEEDSTPAAADEEGNVQKAVKKEESEEKEKDLPEDDAMDVDPKSAEDEKPSVEEEDGAEPTAGEAEASTGGAMDVDAAEVGGAEKEEAAKKDADDAEETPADAVKTEEKDEPKADDEELPKAEEEAKEDDKEESKPDDKDDAEAKEAEADEKPAPKRQIRYLITDDAKSAWTAEEDLRLLDAILTCGLGNWPDIAEHINGGTNGEGDAGTNANGGAGNGIGNKSDKQCMERYLDDFMGRYGHNLPPYTMVPVEQGEEDEDEKDEPEKKPEAAPESSDGEASVAGVAARKRPRRSVTTAAAVEVDDPRAPGFKKTKFAAVPTEALPEAEDIWPRPYLPNTGVKQGDEVARDLWYRSELAFVRQTVGASNKAEAERIRKEFIERRAQGLAGYEANVLPPRLEDTKHLPGAELAGYMARRGDFDVEWDNDAEKIISEMEFSADDTKADRDLKLEVIQIFNKKLDERERRKNFVLENKLLNYRENQERMWKLPPDERHLVQRLRMFARFHTPEEHRAFVDKVLEAKRLRKEIAKLQMYRRLGITSLADAEKYEIDKQRRELHRTAWIKKEEEKRKAAEEAARAAKENSTVAGVAPPPPASAEGPIGTAANQSLEVWRQFKRSKKEGASEDAPSKETGSEDVKDETVAKFVIKDKPGYDLLSKNEAGLCKRLRLLPQNYLDVKKALIAESLNQGVWNPSSSAAGGQKGGRSIFKVDITQRDGIIDFVLKAGWIPTRPTVS